MRVVIKSVACGDIEVFVEPSDTIGSLKDWLVNRDVYACSQLKHGSQKLKYDFLTFEDYAIREGSTLLAHGMPVGTTGMPYGLPETELMPYELCEVNKLRDLAAERRVLTFEQDYPRCVTHDFVDTFYDGTSRSNPRHVVITTGLARVTPGARIARVTECNNIEAHELEIIRREAQRRRVWDKVECKYTQGQLETMVLSLPWHT